MTRNTTVFPRILILISLILTILFMGCTSPSAETIGAPLPEPAPETYPEAPVDPAQAEFSLSAVDFVAQLDAGWNLGNTLDAHSGSLTGLATETTWGQPVTTQAMMEGLKTSGITTVRIPVTWHNHVDEAFTVDTEWMDRVKEVVDYALAEDLFVIINMHHDNEKEYYFPDREHAGRSMEFVTRIWKQIALVFRNYDERLIFEILNEPRLVGYSNEWVWSDSDPKMREAAEVIGELEQSALNEIRASGSNNAQRYVMVTPYVASPWAAFSTYFDIPEDTADDKLILSVHAYTPYPFAMQDPGVSDFTNSHKGEIDGFMNRLNTQFVENGLPVIIGEYGATNKENIEDRVEWFSYYCGKAAEYGMSTIVWDNGNYIVPTSGKYSELYGYYNRNQQTWYFPSILSAILSAYN